MKKLFYFLCFHGMFLCVLNPSYGQNPKPEIYPQICHNDGINSMLLSQDGRWLLSTSTDNTAKLWDIETGKILRNFFFNSYATSAVFSPGFSTITAGTASGNIYVCDIEKDTVLKTLSGHQTMVSFLFYLNNGKELISVDFNNNIRIWDVENAKEIKSFSAVSSYCCGAALMADQKTVMTCGNDKVFVWDISKGSLEEKIKIDNFTTSFALSPTNKYYCTGDMYGKIKVSETGKNKIIRTLEGHTNMVDWLEFSSDNNYLLSSGEDSLVILWKLADGSKVKTFKASQKVGRTAFFKGNKAFFVGDYFGNISLWDVEKGIESDRYINPSKRITAVVFTPDGKYAIGSSDDNTLKYWDIKNGRLINSLVGHQSKVLSLAISQDGKILVTGSSDQSIKIWDVTSGRELKTLAGHTASVNGVAVSPDKKFILSGSADKTVRLWDINNGSEIRSYSTTTGSPGVIYSVAFSPDGKHVAAGGSGRILKIWETETGTEKISINDVGSVIDYVVFSTDGKAVFTGTQNNFVIQWDISSGKRIRKFEGHQNRVESITFSADGKTMATGSYDNSIILWGTEGGNVLKKFKGHHGFVNSVTLDSEGKYLLSGSSDGSVRYWDVFSSKEIASFFSFPGGEWVVMTPDGYFNAAEKGAENINVRQGLKVYSMDNFFDTYFRPDIIQQRLENKQLQPQSDSFISKGFKLPPLVTIKGDDSPSQGFSPAHKISIVSAKQQYTLTVDVTDQGGGIDEVRLYQNGKLIEGTKRGFKEINKTTEKRTYQYTLTLIDGVNEIKATAFNSDRVESIPDVVDVVYRGEKTGATLYILAVGVNTYKNPRYNLKYAVPDADAFVKALSENAEKLFRSVQVKMIKNTEATKVIINNALADLQSKVQPQDVFVFYYAGHGIMTEGNGAGKDDYFLVLNDVVQMTADLEQLSASCISSHELSETLISIKAQKQLVVLDACQSGGAANAFTARGAAEEKAMLQLARSAGIVMLAAAGMDQYATEFAPLGHGVFTYSIIEGLNGNADGAGKDNKITVFELKAWLEDNVPELTMKYKGEAQYPTGYSKGQDFPMKVLVK